jgi:tetratricopeptide (TPR) repeat protein
VPGQFWFEYNFQRDGIVLDERLEIKVPGDRAIKFKGPEATQTIKPDAGFRRYTWTYSRLQSTKETESDQKKIEALRGRSPAPDVQLSSFQSWAEVGQWYWNLQSPRIEPSAAVRTKAAELTNGMTDDAAKLQALYTFVSLQYPYIGIAFGIGRYQPHAADDVLSNNYGDCKDKHTLLASLLQASGITLYPALINSARKLDPDVPSPGQFDHIIGYLPHGKTALWLDTTPEVGPLGYLLTPLRDKPALVMLGEKSAQLINTPADPPFTSSQAFKIEGKLRDDGSFEAHIQDTSRGDAEFIIRSAFRRLPQPQWRDLVQQISYGLGYAGTVSDVSAGAPDLLAEPFHFSYSYNRKDYPDWANHQFTVPGVPFYMPPAKDDTQDPVWLGPPLETVSDSKVELPKGYKPQIPSDVDLKYDFAEYHATYSQDHDVLSAKRRLVVKLREVPVAELDDYRSFIKKLQNDVNRYVQTSSSGPAFVQSPSGFGMLPRFLAGIRSLPDSSSPEASRMEADVLGAGLHGDSLSAASQLKHAVDADPKFARAWVELAAAYMAQRQNDAALDALRTAIDVDPKQLVIHKIYALILGTMGRAEGAQQAWRDALKIAPDDADANSAIAGLLVQDKRYQDALPYLETLTKSDTSRGPQVRLGSAYLRAGQTEKGTATLEKVLAADSRPGTFNDVAYEMAEAVTSLPKALEYAQRAVEDQERQSHDVKLSSLLQGDLACTQDIGSYWDTLGWVQFRLGDFEQAESYLHAAWVLTQLAVVADHLGQVYEHEKETEKAIHMYRLALAAPENGGVAKETIRQRLDHLGVKAPSTPMEWARSGDRSGDELSQLRTVKLKRLIAGKATAEFFLLFTPDSKVQDAAFINGDEKLRSVSAALTDAKFQVSFPAASSAHLVRRAVVMCSTVSGCEAVLYTPNSVHSVN